MTNEVFRTNEVAGERSRTLAMRWDFHVVIGIIELRKYCTSK